MAVSKIWQESAEEMRKAFENGTLKKKDVILYMIENGYKSMDGSMKSLRKIPRRKS